MGELMYMPDADKPPIFVSAGIIKSELQIVQFANIPDIAVQVVGSFSENEWGGTDPTGRKTVFWWDEKNQAAYNAIGLRNPGRKEASRYLPRAIQKVHAAGQLAVISITSLAHEKPETVLPALAEWALDMGADGIELDGSCPNHGEILSENVESTSELAAAVRQRVGKEPYISMKFPDLPDQIIDQYKSSGRLPIDGAVLINAIRRQVPINPVTGQSYIEVNNGYAGQSGPAIANIARSNLQAWTLTGQGKVHAGWRLGYQVWSVGGVNGGHDIYERVHHMGAFMVGAAQPFYKTLNPGSVAKRWAEEYDISLAGAA